MDITETPAKAGAGRQSRAYPDEGMTAEAPERHSRLTWTVREPEPVIGPEIRTVPAEVAVRENADAVAPDEEEPVGAALLTLVAGYLDHYMDMSARNRDMITLWVAHAVARDRDDTGVGPLIWRATPRLLLTSKERGSGKSTALDLIAILTRARNGRMPKVTPSAIAKVLGRRHEAALLDEAKLMFGSGQRSQELQGCLLAGYTPKSNYTVSRGGRDDPVPLFGPVAYAGKDELITDTGGVLGDLLDRTLTARLAAASRIMPEVDEIAEDEGDLLADALIQWTDMERDALRAKGRELAEADREQADVRKGDARLAQIWRPLRAVAAVAGSDWPRRAERAMGSMRAGGQAAGLEGRLADLQARFAAWKPVPAVPADDDWDDES